MNHREQQLQRFQDNIDALDAIAQSNFAEAARIERFVKSRDVPDPMQEKLYAMADKDTEYGRRSNDNLEAAA